MVDTPMTADGPRDVTPYALKRIADPLEIARAILFLTGSESSFVTGAALAIRWRTDIPLVMDQSAHRSKRSHQ